MYLQMATISGIEYRWRDDETKFIKSDECQVKRQPRITHMAFRGFRAPVHLAITARKKSRMRTPR